MKTQAETKTTQPSGQAGQANPPGSSGGLFDNDGNVQIEALSRGMFTLRFTPDLATLTFTWVPDNPAEEQLQKQFDLTPVADPAGDIADFRTCMQGQTIRSVGDLPAAIAHCTPELFRL